ncbi:hypothetical protein BH09ACT5_BH09ACT5_24370 [soil metagenome]
MWETNVAPGVRLLTRRGFVTVVAAGGALALVIVLVIVSVVASGGPVAVGEDRSTCGLPGFERESSLAKAPEVEWEAIGTVSVPVDPQVGPGKVDDHGLRTCFAHTAQGALYAVVNYVAASADPRTNDYATQLLEPGPGRDVLEADEPEEDWVPDYGYSPSARLQVAGFKVNSYTSDEALIDVVWRVSSYSEQLMSVPLVLHWTEGDWKVVVTDDGATQYPAAPLSSLGGYIPWAAP